MGATYLLWSWWLDKIVLEGLCICQTFVGRVAPLTFAMSILDQYEIHKKVGEGDFT